MKIKEIDVFIYEDDIKKDQKIVYGTRLPPGNGSLKAKLIIEMPEKEITITESQFDKAWTGSQPSSVHFEYLTDIKKELGF